MKLLTSKTIYRAVLCENTEECLKEVQSILTERQVIKTDEGLHVRGTGTTVYGQWFLFSENGDWDELDSIDDYAVLDGDLVTAVKVRDWWAVSAGGFPTVFNDKDFQVHFTHVHGDIYLTNP